MLFIHTAVPLWTPFSAFPSIQLEYITLTLFYERSAVVESDSFGQGRWSNFGVLATTNCYLPLHLSRENLKHILAAAVILLVALWEQTCPPICKEKNTGLYYSTKFWPTILNPTAAMPPRRGKWPSSEAKASRGRPAAPRGKLRNFLPAATNIGFPSNGRLRSPL